MTSARQEPPVENVAAGAILSLLAIPVGVIILTLISTVGFAASIVGFVIAICAVWLYRRGSGGIISRTGAWVVTAVVAFTLLFGIWVSLVVEFAGGLGKLHNIGLAEFWPLFNRDFSKLVSENGVFILLVLAFGVLGAFRTLRRAFITTRIVSAPNTSYGSPDGPPTVTPTIYTNDVDGAPTGSADDRTPPPTIGT
jgi:hypothetical protein